MDKILIQGGERLKGAVKVSGAKNAALPVIAACILTEGWHRLKNIPKLKDTTTIKLIMSKMGVPFRKKTASYPSTPGRSGSARLPTIW
jgi:UDP-N-acetylglucosamine 1-carboxyvinyltransferase